MRRYGSLINNINPSDVYYSSSIARSINFVGLDKLDKTGPLLLPEGLMLSREP